MIEDSNEEQINKDFSVVTTNDIDGAEIIDYVGIVQGSTVRSRNVGSDVFAKLKNLVGGELVGYSKLLQTSRDQAYKRMLDDAKAKGANAIVCFRFQTSTITEGASEILAYGTGVKIKK
jgi:uncharacterized protein YbjQ (UPF0145 family)